MSDAILGPRDAMEEKQAASPPSFILVGRHQYPDKGRNNSRIACDQCRGGETPGMNWRMTGEAWFRGADRADPQEEETVG